MTPGTLLAPTNLSVPAMADVQHTRSHLTGFLGQNYVPGYRWPGRALITHADIRAPGRAQDPVQEVKWNVKGRAVEGRETDILSGP